MSCLGWLSVWVSWAIAFPFYFMYDLLTALPQICSTCLCSGDPMHTSAKTASLGLLQSIVDWVLQVLWNFAELWEERETRAFALVMDGSNHPLQDVWSVAGSSWLRLCPSLCEHSVLTAVGRKRSAAEGYSIPAHFICGHSTLLTLQNPSQSCYSYMRPGK